LEQAVGMILAPCPLFPCCEFDPNQQLCHRDSCDSHVVLVFDQLFEGIAASF